MLDGAGMRRLECKLLHLHTVSYSDQVYEVLAGHIPWCWMRLLTSELNMLEVGRARENFLVEMMDYVNES